MNGIFITFTSGVFYFNLLVYAFPLMKEEGVINEERSLRSMRTRTHCLSCSIKGACTSEHRRRNASTQLRPAGKPRFVLTYVQIVSRYYLTKTWPIENREINILILNDS